MTDALLKPREVAELLSVSVNTVHAWCQDGKIHSVRLPNGYFRIPESVLAEILTRGHPKRLVPQTRASVRRREAVRKGLAQFGIMMPEQGAKDG